MSEYRVLHVIDSMGYGGVESALQILTPALQEEGIDTLVAVLGPPHTGVNGFNGTVDVHLLEVGRTWLALRGGTRLGKLVQEEKVDVVHSNLFFSELHVAASRVVNHDALKAVTFHNLVYMSHPPSTMLKRARRHFHGLMTRSTFQLPFAVSRAVAEHHEDHLGVKGIEVVPNPIDLDLLEKINRGEGPGVPDWWDGVKDGLNLVVAGRLSPEKGQKHAIEAVSTLRDEGIGVNLHLIGAGPDLQRLRICASELGLRDRVFFHGTIPRDVLFEVLKNSTVLLCPSLQEGFGLAAAEALAVGCPVVGTRCGGLQEVVEEGRSGILVPPGNSEAIAAGLKKLLDDERLRRDFVAAGKDSVMERFSPKVVASSLASAYKRGLETRKSTGAS